MNPRAPRAGGPSPRRGAAGSAGRRPRAGSELLTLGYEQRTLEEFLALLRQAKVDVVMDVRDTPWSHKPGFSKKPLAEAVTAAGMTYVHAGFAGNPKALRSRAADDAEALRLYRRHLRGHPAIVKELGALLADFHAAGRRVCLICFERDPGACHRAILAEAWAGPRRASVRHLGTEPAAS